MEASSQKAKKVALAVIFPGWTVMAHPVAVVAHPEVVGPLETGSAV